LRASVALPFVLIVASGADPEWPRGDEPAAFHRDAAAASATPPHGSGASGRTAAPYLQIREKHFVRPDGTLFPWRGITAFRLLEVIARGRAGEAEAFLDWGSARGLTVVRVLAMARHLFELAPDDGRAALPRLLDMAKARRMYVEVVALADTADIQVDIDRHVREIGAMAAEYGNALVEIANEPAHPTQAGRVHDPLTLGRLARLVPHGVPVALGSAEENGRFSGGDYATVHFPRDGGRGGWGHVAALASGAELARKWNKPVVNDEPIGAAEDMEPGRRDNNPERFRAAALLSRMIGLGSTFHYEDGLHARLPEGRQLECFEAWQEAWTLLPGEGTLTLMRPGAQGSPVRSVKGDHVGAYAAVRGANAWLLVIGTRGTVEATWADEWQPAARTDWKESLWWPAVRAR
jgi:hypothetical protein